MARTSYRVKFPGSLSSQLAGIVDRPDDRDDAPVLVLSHCFTCNKDLKAIVRLSRALAEQGIAVLRYDMTGLGGSEGDFSATNFTSNQADLRAAISFADQTLGPVRVLRGHSFGGAASLAVAGSADVATLRALVTLAAPSDTQHLAVLLSRMNPAIQSEGRGEVSIGGRSWVITREMLADFRSHDLPAQVTKIRVPTMIFHSPTDETVGFDHAIRLQGLLQNGTGGSDASLVALSGADHLLAQQSADLSYVADTSAAFVRRYTLSN